jgi:hypothetical protein
MEKFLKRGWNKKNLKEGLTKALPSDIIQIQTKERGKNL